MLKTLVDTALVHLMHFRVKRLAKRRCAAHPEGNNALLLAWNMPPEVTGGVYRPLSFVRYSQQQGWRIGVLCGQGPNQPTQNGTDLLAQIPPQVRVERVPCSNLQPSWKLSVRVDGGFPEAMSMALTGARAWATAPPNVVVASGPPFCSFVAAWYLARHFDAALVLDYRDEWSECPFPFVQSGPHDRVWERRCLAAAARVIFTTKSHMNHQREVFDTTLTTEKCRLVPNGWDAADLEKVTAPNALEPDKNEDALSQLTFVGALSVHSLAGALMDSLARVFNRRPDLSARWRLRFVGARSTQGEDELKRFEFQENLELVGPVTKKKATQAMREASALFLVSRPALAAYLPGKLFEYLAAERPVIIFGHRGEATELVESCGGGLFIAEGDDAGLERFLDSVKEGTPAWFDPIRVRGHMQSYRRDVLAQRFFDILDEVSVNSAHLRGVAS